MNSPKNAILAIDTATQVCSVALLLRDEVVFERQSTAGRNHAALIATYCHEAQTFASAENLSLVAVAVSDGPGSYTGLRIGASFAKGFCFGHQLPLIAIPGLRALFSGFRSYLLEKKIEEEYSQVLLCPMLDARRMEVYCALYQLDGMEVVAPSAKIITEESFQAELEGKKAYLFGDGAMKCRSVFNSPQMEIVPFDSLARYFREDAFNTYDHRRFCDVAYWAPNYLKPYQVIKSKNKVLSQVNKE